MSLLAPAFGLASLCSCCAGIAVSRMTTDCCKKRKATTSMSTQTEPEKIEPAVEFRNAKPLPGGRLMRPASGSDDRGRATAVAGRFANAETMARHYLRDDLRALAREHGIAVSGSKLEIAMRLQGLSGKQRID